MFDREGGKQADYGRKITSSEAWESGSRYGLGIQDVPGCWAQVKVVMVAERNARGLYDVYKKGRHGWRSKKLPVAENLPLFDALERHLVPWEQHLHDGTDAAEQEPRVVKFAAEHGHGYPKGSVMNLLWSEASMGRLSPDAKLPGEEEREQAEKFRDRYTKLSDHAIAEITQMDDRTQLRREFNFKSRQVTTIGTVNGVAKMHIQNFSNLENPAAAEDARAALVAQGGKPGEDAKPVNDAVLRKVKSKKFLKIG